MGKFVYFAYEFIISNSYLYASSDNSNYDNEKIHCTSTNSMITNFLDAWKIMDYENTIYSIAPSQDFHPLSLFKDKYSKNNNKFQHCSMGNFNKFLKVFHINK
jgi:hypothetical protein